ncbi:putative retrotransposon gag domain-containing protein [Arabidopsis thaliana]
MHSRMHLAVSDAPDIDRVIEETRRTPFTDKIACFRLRDVERLRFPEYVGMSDPKAHLRSFRFAITRAYLTDEENEAGHCRFFAENLVGHALEWFASLEGNSIDTFDQLTAAFLKQYSVLIEHRTSEADLWSLYQLQNESLRSYVEKFKAIKSKIANRKLQT